MHVLETHVIDAFYGFLLEAPPTVLSAVYVVGVQGRSRSDKNSADTIRFPRKSRRYSAVNANSANEADRGIRSDTEPTRPCQALPNRIRQKNIWPMGVYSIHSQK